MSEDLLIKYLLGEGSNDEALKVEAWAAASSANTRKLEEIKTILETSNRLAQVSPMDETEAWERFKSKRDTTRNEKVRITPMRVYANWLKIAAVMFLLTAGGWMASYLYSSKSGESAGWITLRAKSEVRVDTLPDGSILHINKNSTLTYSRNFKSKRTVKLTGEAFFNVKHNDALPFTAQVEDVNVRDVGTAFNIKSRQHNTEVIVESGTVKVSRDKDAVQLNAQQMVNIKAGDKGFSVKRNSDELYNYYMSNTFVANKTPLWRLIDVLNEAYGTDIRIENSALRNAPITITIRLQDSLNSILNLISLTTPDLHVQKAGGTYIIK
ncbi:FecR family protein [Pedobacter sp. L105]|uniref:FecR family protein n=1 Tax=Pedobacter sp. L105 TaxID=1641871 RepID=UPI00131B11F0|nr:FecR domain-containing protein [Pedobacter sp. L105]